MATMASSFLPVNNAPPTDPALFAPAALPTALPQRNRNPDMPDSPHDHKENASVSSVGSRRSDQPNATVETRQRGADNAVSDGPSEGEHDGSENGGDTASTGPPSKKKKGQRFFCTDFPPCNLSFTRSEHLARHIRKHTGERPFQCHCSRRFSRLDNLRQHAQTVHVNEEIPGDSLAASVTRVQRQIRTDRIRGPGRARAGTAGSVPGHARGHSRNLSTSSVASSYGPPDLRRRPPPLMMANDPTGRGKLTLDTMGSPPRTPPNQMQGYPAQSPSSFFTPSSATFSAVPGHEGSPYYVSPASSSSGFWGDSRALRRLSFPTGVRPFEMPQHPYPPPFRPPPHPSYPGDGPVFASPAATQPPQDASDLDWRRRTWHPSSPSFPRPATSGALDAQQTTRLPGIESFDRVQQRPSTPPRREPTPMQVDQTAAPPTSVPAFDPAVAPSARAPPPVSGGGHRRGNLSIDTTLQRTLTRLDLGNPPTSQPPTSSETDHPQPWTEPRPLQPAPAIPSHVQPFNAVGERRHSYVPPEYLARPPTTQMQSAISEAKPEQRENEEGRMDRLEALVAVATSESKNQMP